MADTPTEPSAIRAGDSVAWTRALDGYPASSGWVLAYRLLSPTSPAIDIDAAASGDAHAVSLAAATTAPWPAGEYTLVATVSRGSERITLRTAPLTVLPDLFAAASHDGRSAARVALDAARAAWLARTPGTPIRYAVGDRSMEFADHAAALAHIRALEAEVARERPAMAIANGAGMPPGRVMVRM